MHSLFFSNPLLHSTQRPFHSHTTPHADAEIYENEQTFLMELAVPGFDKDHFSISASEHQLVLKASRERVIPEGFTRIQEGVLSETWERTFRFKQPIKADSIEAVVTNGVLTLTIPKKTKEHLVTVQAR